MFAANSQAEAYPRLIRNLYRGDAVTIVGRVPKGRSEVAFSLKGLNGKKTYEAFFNMLKKRGKSRSYSTGGKTYTYTEYEIASKSYNPEKAYQPIFAIYDNDIAHLFYRFLYSYEDADSIVDWKGCMVPTSLNALRRTKYQFMGSWPLNVINTEYPAWCKRIEAQKANEGFITFTLSATTNTGNNTTATYSFADGITITNTKDKKYGTGVSNTVKYSANVDYTVHLPAGMVVSKVQFYGYDNYDEDAYLKSFNGTTFVATDYVFPAKNGTNVIDVTHTIELPTPVTDSFTFSLGAKQCCLVITLFQGDGTVAVTLPISSPQAGSNIIYNLHGKKLHKPTKGVYIINGQKAVAK